MCVFSPLLMFISYYRLWALTFSFISKTHNASHLWPGMLTTSISKSFFINGQNLFKLNMNFILFKSEFWNGGSFFYTLKSFSRVSRHLIVRAGVKVKGSGVHYVNERASRAALCSSGFVFRRSSWRLWCFSRTLNGAGRHLCTSCRDHLNDVIILRSDTFLRIVPGDRLNQRIEAHTLWFLRWWFHFCAAPLRRLSACLFTRSARGGSWACVSRASGAAETGRGQSVIRGGNGAIWGRVSEKWWILMPRL